MTFAQTSIGRTISRTSLLLKRQLWIWPIVAIFLLASIAYFASSSIRSTMQTNLSSELQTLVNVERAMILKWLKTQEANAESLARDRQVRSEIDKLVAASQLADVLPSEAELSDRLAELSPADLATMRRELTQQLGPGMAAQGYGDYVLIDRRLKIVSSNRNEMLNLDAVDFEEKIGLIFDGAALVTPPFASVAAVPDEFGNVRTGAPTMFVFAPVRDDNLQIVAALGFRLRPEREFTQLLQIGRLGESGETYAFDDHGNMVSNSRFDEQLILLGLLPDVENSSSLLNLQLRDPLGDLTTGYRPSVRRSELPLTLMAQQAVLGQSGVDVEGYRDYRGVEVVGAWTWLPDYHMGLATEIDKAEAYRPLTILSWTFYSLYVLLGIAAIAIFVFTLIVGRLQQEVRRAAIEAKQLGQYRLEEQIGAGAMGIVYKGHHAMLRRPTAIKMLNVDRVDEGSIQRFEREVQLTCQLNSPNTVAIYDYGRTPEGVFYYAMEYLDGIDLQTLVEHDGPQHPGRVASILRQICNSLYEAHCQGLVHRDVKPANIMLNRRGGQPDVTKVLDFGLVKNLEQEKESPGSLSGTPLYMSPEAIRTPDQVDARSDLYAVGAVGYFLLTGETVFSAATLGELCRMHLEGVPIAPSHRLGHAVSVELEHAILSCLEKNRAQRPQTARELAAMLERISDLPPWTYDDAEAWWSRYERGTRPSRRRGSHTPHAPTINNTPGLDGTILVK